MVENDAKLIDRKTLVQVNATIIAGMLIFLTIGEFNSNMPFKETILFAVIAGFLFLIGSMITCFLTEERMRLNRTSDGIKIETYTANRLADRFRIAETLFIGGTLWLFGSVTLVMFSKMFVI